MPREETAVGFDKSVNFSVFFVNSKLGPNIRMNFVPLVPSLVRPEGVIN